MYCKSCGNEIPVNSKFCTKCGTPVSVEINETSDSSAPAASATPTPATATPVAKKSKAPVVAIICVIAALILGAVGFGLFWINRPINKINKAIKAEEYEQVAELYQKLTKDEEIESVDEQLLAICEKYYEDYADENIEFDDAVRIFNILEYNVLDSNSDFKIINKNLRDLKNSRVAYANAMEAFNNKNYEEAIKFFKKVDRDDKNYELAEEKIAESNELMIPDIAGEWTSIVDMGDLLSQSIGIGKIGFPLPITLVFKFNSDGTCVLSLDTTSSVISFENYIDSIFEIVCEKEFSGLGLSMDELDQLVRAEYGMSIKEYYLQQFDMNALLDELSTSEEFTYTVDKKRVTVTNNSGQEDKLEFKGDKLILNDAGADQEFFSSMGITLPIEFTKKQ